MSNRDYAIRSADLSYINQALDSLNLYLTQVSDNMNTIGQNMNDVHVKV